MDFILTQKYQNLIQKRDEHKKSLGRLTTSSRSADSHDEKRRQQLMDHIVLLNEQLEVLTKQLQEHKRAEDGRKRAEDERKRAEDKHKRAELEREHAECIRAQHVAIEQRAQAEQKALAEKIALEWDAFTCKFQTLTYNKQVSIWNAEIDKKIEAKRVAFVRAMFGHDNEP